MPNKITCSPIVLPVFLLTNAVTAAPTLQLSDEQAAAAKTNYQQYCALCHGGERQGHVNDHAPSLRSRSLMTSGEREIFRATAYGRYGTAMAGYLDEVGGPMSAAEIRDLTQWLRSQVPVDEFEFSYAPVTGDIEAGKTIYAEQCASCHGVNGEGGTGTALGNPAMLSLTTDGFLRYAIEHGREGTDMRAYGDELTPEEIDGVTAFLRSRAIGWSIEKPVFRAPPTADNYVINPEAATAEFKLKDGLYVTSADLLQALQDKKRMVLLDTRALSRWQLVHIDGAVPIPYYYNDVASLAKDLPDDGTMIVTYCECPRAAAEYVNQAIRASGFTNTAVLWEGIGGWIAMGYPVSRGETSVVDARVVE